MTNNDHQPTEETAAIFRLRRGSAVINWFHRNPRHSNQHCLYCGRFVGAGSPIKSDKEHLIGRRMVPANSFSDPSAFNFMFRACVECNGEKSGLEDRISAVTLLTSPGRAESADVDALARRKAARSFDPRQPGQPVGDVRHEFTVEFGGILRFGLVASAQLDPRKVELLAFRHIQGLFSLSTSVNPLVAENTRLLPPEHFGFFGSYMHRDWGNNQLVAISKRARSMPSAVEATTAGGYFRCALRREDPEGSPWFWALEWNKSVRLIGWIGDAASAPAIFRELPELEWHDLGMQNGVRTRARREIQLAQVDDVLFDA